jgi:hypothetical protein
MGQIQPDQRVMIGRTIRLEITCEDLEFEFPGDMEMVIEEVAPVIQTKKVSVEDAISSESVTRIIRFRKSNGR